MPMPNHLVLIRHGESEANVNQSHDKKGTPHELRHAINDRPDWQQRLSKRGIEQAKQAKLWIDKNLGGAASFDLRYFSPFLRTRETAAYIGGEECGDWIIEDRVVERSWGAYGALSKEDREKQFALTAKMYKQSPWYVKLDGGESRYDVSARWRDFQGTLHREGAGKKVLVVTHGDVMSVVRYNVERLLPEQFEAIDEDPNQKIMNLTALEYARFNPYDPEEVRDKLSWLRMTHLTEPENSPFDGQWVELPPRPIYTGADLLGQAALVPCLMED